MIPAARNLLLSENFDFLWACRGIQVSAFCFNYKRIPNNTIQRLHLSEKFLAQKAKNKKKRKKELPPWPDLNTANKAATVTIPSGKVKVEPSSRRHVVLERVYLDVIIEEISLHPRAKELAAYGLEIVHCRVLGDFTAVHVYWMCSEPSYDKQISDLLQELTPSLRQSLGLQRIFGRFPNLLFLRDQSHAMIADLEKAYASADYGPDFVPQKTDSEDKIEVLRMPIEEEFWKKIDESDSLSSKEAGVGEEQEVEVPEFLPIREDVFGVKRSRILERVQKNIVQMKGAHREEEFLDCQPTINTSAESRGPKITDIFPRDSVHSRAKDLQKWVHEYNKERRRLRKSIEDSEKEIMGDLRIETFIDMEESDDMNDDFEKYLTSSEREMLLENAFPPQTGDDYEDDSLREQ